MNTRLLLIGSGLAAALSLGFAWRGAKSAEANEEERIRVAAQHAEGQASLRRDSEQLKVVGTREEELKRALEKARAELNAARNSSSISTVPGKDSKTNDPARMTMQQVIANDPKLQALALASRRASLERTYGPLFRSLGLRPEDGERFCEIMIRSHAQAQDLMVTIQTEGLPPNDPGVVAFRRKAEEELRTAQRELLGPAGYQQLQDYERARDVRQAVERFAGAAALADLQLTYEQAERLTRTIAMASTSYQNGGGVEWQRIDWKAVDVRVAEVLSPAQLALFQRIEPLGGGRSRWMGILDQRMQAARKTEPSRVP